MTLITIPDAAHRGTLLRGGWTTEVPNATFAMSDPRLQDLLTVLKRYGASHAVAEREVATRMQHFWTSAWRERIMKNVARWASVYEEERGTLDGFDAALVARLWIPGKRAGKPPHASAMMKELMGEMQQR